MANVYDTIPGDTAVADAPAAEANPYDSIPSNVYDSIPTDEAVPAAPTPIAKPAIPKTIRKTVGLRTIDVPNPAAGPVPGQFQPPPPEESILGISPEKVMTGQEMTTATGLPKALTIPVSGGVKAVAGVGKFLTSPEGIGQSLFAAVPGYGLLQRAKWIADMAQGAGQTTGNISSRLENLAQNPKGATTDDMQGLAEDTANAVLMLYGSGKLSSHEVSNLTGVRAPLGRVTESTKTRFAKDMAEQLNKSPGNFNPTQVAPIVQPATPGEQNAIREPIAASVPQLENGTQVGQAAPLRQPGEVAPEGQPVVQQAEAPAQNNAVKVAKPLSDVPTLTELLDSHPDQVVEWKKRVKYGPETSKSIADQLKSEDVPALEAQRDALRKEYQAKFEAIAKAGKFEDPALMSEAQNLSLKAQTLNEIIQDKNPKKVEPVEPIEEFKAREDARKAKIIEQEAAEKAEVLEKETADLQARGYNELRRQKMTPEEKAAAIAQPIPTLEADAARWHEIQDAIKAEKEPVARMKLIQASIPEGELIKNRNTKNPGVAPERPPKPTPPPKPKLADAKKEFTDLLQEHGAALGFNFDPDLYGTGVLGRNVGGGTAGIRGNIEAAKAVQRLHNEVLKALGMDHNIKTPTAFAEALPKLKKLIEEHEAKENQKMDDIERGNGPAGDEGSSEFLPEEDREFVGLGGAVPGEFERNPNTATGIKNATVDAERVKRGLPAAMAPAKRTSGEVWDRAMAKIDQDPDYPDRLMAELRERPRALTDLEDATLLHRQIDLQNEYGKATRDLAEAKSDGRLEDAEDRKLRVNELRDQLYDLYEINKKSGTETGRGLNARKMMAYEDFSLAKMEMEKRAIANEGSPLTEKQEAEIKSLHEEIAAKQKAYDEYVQKTEARDAERAVKEAIDRVEREAKAPKASRYVIQLAEKWVAKQDVRADAARKRLRERLGRTSAGVDPTILSDLAEIGASHLGHIGLDFAKWSEKILGDVGDFVKPHLQEVFDASRAIWEKSGAPAAVKKTVLKVKDMTGDQRKADLSNKIADKFAKGKKDEISVLVRKLARQFVEDGISDRNELIDAVHGVLKEVMPEMTRREAMDAISGYGEFKMLSQGEIDVTLRDLKRQMQNVAKLDDMLAGEPPKKSGLQLTDDSPSQELRRLVAEVNKAKNEFQVPVTDSRRQLKSALDTVKTRLKNRITDYEEKLKNQDFEPRQRKVVRLDNEAMRLKAAAEAAKLKYMRSLELDKLNKRSKTEKIFEQISGSARASALSGYHTLAKLAGYSVAKLGEIPLGEAVGAAISKVPGFRRIFKGANLESGSTLSALGKFYSDFATKGMRQAADIMRKGESVDKTLYGKPDVAPPRWYDFFGRLHAAEKAPLRVGSQSMYFKRAYENAIKAGLDVNNEFVRAQINKEAYDYSQRQILMEDNKFAQIVNMGLKRLEQKNPKTGKVEIQNALISTLLKTLVTKGIIRTPANYFAQSLARTPIGLAAGLAKTIHAHGVGIEKLTPVEKNAIASLVKVGAVGSAFFLWGMIDATQDQEDRVFGGYYSPGRKKGGKDVPWGKLRVDGHTLPHLVTHNPLTESAQMGSTLMRVFINRSKKGDDGTTAALEGGVKSLVGLVSKAPIANPIMRLDSSGSKVVGGFIQGLVPQLVQNIAEDTDLGENGVIERAPVTALDQVAVGIPGLRQTVKAKK